VHCYIVFKGKHVPVFQSDQPDTSLVRSFRDYLQGKKFDDKTKAACPEAMTTGGMISVDFREVAAISAGQLREQDIVDFAVWYRKETERSFKTYGNSQAAINAFSGFQATNGPPLFFWEYVRDYAICIDLREIRLVTMAKGRPANVNLE
jgi:hypothetical protein